MAKYKSYDYSQSVLIPVCLDEQSMPGTLEFAIHTLVQTRIDTSIFDLTKAMATKVDTEEGRRIYPQRLAVVEPVFANIEIHKGMNRFTLRTKIKVNIQWMPYCMIHNIGKILNYGVRYAFT